MNNGEFHVVSLASRLSLSLYANAQTNLFVTQKIITLATEHGLVCRLIINDVSTAYISFCRKDENTVVGV